MVYKSKIFMKKRESHGINSLGAAQIVGLVAFFRYLSKFSEPFHVCFYCWFPCLRQTGLSFPVDEKKARILLNHTFLSQSLRSLPIIEHRQRFFFGSNLSLLQNITTFIGDTLGCTQQFLGLCHEPPIRQVKLNKDPIYYFIFSFLEFRPQ